MKYSLKEYENACARFKSIVERFAPNYSDHPDFSLADFEHNLTIMSVFNQANAHKKSVSGSSHKYLITFTHAPTLSTKEQFKASVIKQLARAIFSFTEHVFEHEDTNIHCHAICESRFTLNATNFKSHATKHGFVQVKTVKQDNGLSDYINKENPSELSCP